MVAVTPVKAQQAGDESVAVGGHPWHLNGQLLGPEMGAFWSLLEPDVASYGAKRHIVWLRIAPD